MCSISSVSCFDMHKYEVTRTKEKLKHVSRSRYDGDSETNFCAKTAVLASETFWDDSSSNSYWMEVNIYSLYQLLIIIMLIISNISAR